MPETSDGQRVLIAGAGPAGLTAAYAALERGMRPIVFEKRDLVGGHARTEQKRGFRFDIGGHRFFTKIPEIEDIWHELLEDRFLRVDRLSRIYYDRKFFYYPLRLGNVVAGLGLVNSLFAVLSFLRAAASPTKEEDNFEQWITNRFGARLYRTFFKAYTEKVWGIPCDQIGAEWAAQRIRGLSLPRAILNAVRGNRGGVRTLIEEFGYPELGPGMMWERMSERIIDGGGEVHLQSEVVEIHAPGGRVAGFTIHGPGGDRYVEGDAFISTMPIPELVRRHRPAAPREVREAAEDLSFRDFMVVCLVVDHPDLFPDNWVYIHDPEVRMGRLQNFKNWSSAMVPDPSKTSLGAEYFVTEGDDLWSLDDEALVELAARELADLGLRRGAEVEWGTVYRQKYAYPIYDGTYGRRLEILEKHLRGLANLQTIGRNGLHRYDNQDHAMLTALLAIDNLSGATHDLWSVNTDQSYHEEGSGEGLSSWTEPLAS